MLRACALSILLACCAPARGQGSCPWLTQGTAAALMGGDVTANVHVQDGEGACEFIHTPSGNHSSTDNLRMTIMVSHLPFKECATGEKLMGIGQDVVSCTIDGPSQHSAAIRARVRTLYLLVTLAGKDPVMTAKSRRSALEQAAEEVAGNLF